MRKKEIGIEREEGPGQDFRVWAEGQSAVRTLLQRKKGRGVRRPGQAPAPQSWILGVSDVDAYTEVFTSLLSHLVQKDIELPPPFQGDPVQALLQPANKGKLDYFRAYLLFTDKRRLELEIVNQQDLLAFLADEVGYDIAFDKDKVMGPLVAAQASEGKAKQQVQKPSLEDLQTWSAGFFEHIGTCALYLLDQDDLSAQIALSRARAYLIQMTWAAAASQQNFAMDPGDDLENLKTTLDPAAYDHLIRSFSATESRRIWDAIFQSCMLFRKAGLILQDYEGFNYPKRLDVETMKFLRGEWEGSR